MLMWLSIAIGLCLVGLLVRGCCCWPHVCSTRCSPDFDGDMQMVVAGIGGGTCTNCTQLNATWIGAFVDTDDGFGGTDDACFWAYGAAYPEIDIVCVGQAAAGISFRIIFEGGDYIGRGVITFTALFTVGNPQLFFEKNYGATKPDCASFVDEDIPFDHLGGVGGTALCDWTTAPPTFKVTAIP